VSDFASIVGAFEDAGGIVRATRDTLTESIRGLLDNPAMADELAQRGVRCVLDHRGASRANAELLLGLLARSTNGTSDAARRAAQRS
jgi:hypothetical protein